MPSANIANAIPASTATTNVSNFGSIVPSSAINEGIAKCLGANTIATTLPQTAEAPTVAGPKAMPVSALCIGRKPSARSIAYCRRRSA